MRPILTSSFLKQRYLCVLTLSTLFFALLWVSCNKNDDEDLTLDFRKTFTFQDIKDYTRLYRRDDAGKREALTREQAGSFTVFFDTMPAYTELDKIPLDFTGLEFLDNSRVRLFSDGSLGIPKLDTVVAYSQSSGHIINYITVDWTLMDKPLVFTLGNIDGQYLTLEMVWYFYTYNPLIPSYSAVEMAYLPNGIQELFNELSSEFGQGDTLAIHSGNPQFR